MAVFESKYKELSFYCCGELKTFSNGRYSTKEKEEIAVLERLADTVRVDKEEPKKAEEPKATPKPTKKSSAK
jgi:hypothetical protein